MEPVFVGNIILKGKLECLTGLHIGGSKEKMEIGGVDSPVIRDPNTRYPYIPGSSLKGKMRSLLEFSLGKIDKSRDNSYPGCKCGKPDCPVCRVFGSAAENRAMGPTRLLVRDAYPDEETIEMWEKLDSELEYTEYKAENSVDRITSAANPRFIERVVKGSRFNVEFVYGVYKVDEVNDVDYFWNVVSSLKYLEHSALGKSGSRGYGQVRFKFASPIVLLIDDYKVGSDKYKKSAMPHDSEEFKNQFTYSLSQLDNEDVRKDITNQFSRDGK